MAQGGKQHQGAVLLSLGRGLGWLGSVGVVLTAAVNLQVGSTNGVRGDENSTEL